MRQLSQSPAIVLHQQFRFDPCWIVPWLIDDSIVLDVGNLLKVDWYPLVMTNVAIENGPVEIVDCPINSMVMFNSYVAVYQRVNENDLLQL